MLIDFHTHCFTDSMAKNVLEFIGSGGGMIPNTGGTLFGLVESMDKYNVDISCVMNIAQRPKSTHNVNTFAISQASDRIVPFGSVNPYGSDAIAELERISEAGLHGVKFHPDYQGFNVDDPMMREIYIKAGELGLVILFHAGCDVSYAPPYGGAPDKFVKASEWFRGKVVLAHFGGAGFSPEAVDMLAPLPVSFDTAFSYGAVSKPVILNMIEKVGTERIIFGSDSPWHTPNMELHLVDSLGLSPSERDNITYKNALRMLGLTEKQTER